MHDIKDAKAKYTRHVYTAKVRNVDFELTFDEWFKIWIDSGHWEQRGCRKGQYVMSRKQDKGPYSIDNVFIQTASANVTERNETTPQKGVNHPQYGKPGYNTGNTHTAETKKRISESMKKARALQKMNGGI